MSLDLGCNDITETKGLEIFPLLTELDLSD